MTSAPDPRPGSGLLVFQSDFGREEGTVSQMYGVALGVDPALRIHEVTHEITPFDTWEASYRLFQAMASWPKGTVFVSVVDPGVGSDRKSIVAATGTGHYVVTPDNGSLTHTAAHFGVLSVREIDEAVNRAPGSGDSHTFHGRDVYGYTGARLAAGVIGFEGVGPQLDRESLVLHELAAPSWAGGAMEGIIDIHDVHFGNAWTNIPTSAVRERGWSVGDRVEASIGFRGSAVYRNSLIYGRSFSDVPVGEDVLYDNELMHLALSVNQGSFVSRHEIGYGSGWTVNLRKLL